MFRNNIVIPLGQFSHWVSVRAERVIAGNTRTRVRNLSEEEAIEWGGSLIGETFIYSVAAGFVIYEYTDKEEKDAKKKEEIQQWRTSIGQQVSQLQDHIKFLEADCTELRQTIDALSHPTVNPESAGDNGTTSPRAQGMGAPVSSGIGSYVSYGLALVGLGGAS